MYENKHLSIIMKVKNILPWLVILIFLVIGCSPMRNIKVEPPLESSDIQRMIDSPSFVFVARDVTPWNGRRRDLSPGYEVSVTKDTLVSYLPFFGRGYIAPVSPTDVDFDFTSTKFSYKVTPAHNGWEIKIKAQDQPYLRELYFRLFDNGKGSVTVTSIDRSGITYDGYITRRTSYKKK